MIDLNPNQRQAIKLGQPVRATESELGEVIVVRADLYDLIRELLQEEQQRGVIAKMAKKNAIARAAESP